jgi:hypothetical protein
MDAGTAQGSTFTAPQFPEFPLKPISTITAQYPNHTASSFFYPDREKLPPIAKLKIKKVNEIIKKKKAKANDALAANATDAKSTETAKDAEKTAAKRGAEEGKRRNGRKHGKKGKEEDHLQFPPSK